MVPPLTRLSYTCTPCQKIAPNILGNSPQLNIVDWLFQLHCRYTVGARGTPVMTIFGVIEVTPWGGTLASIVSV